MFVLMNKEKGMTDREELSFVGETLINWYKLHKRDLPWRNTKDPYKIWISEIILQQTRVNQGLNYYLRFTERFPDLISLAEAEESEVLNYWQGLGYYSRARNLHATARLIRDQYNGIFPADYTSVLSLKGIGEYTAAAIVSFAWNQPYPAVDGNVFRFISRLLAIGDPIDTGQGKKIFTELAAKMLDPSRAGEFNQAIMEFGALQCVPASPDCGRCPFENNCLAQSASAVEKYPVKQGKTLTKELYLYYFHIKQSGYTYLHQRIKKDIWQHLYEFPSVVSERPLSFEELQALPEFQELFFTEHPLEYRLVIANKKHVLSHRILYAHFYEVILPDEQETLSGFSKIREEDIHQYPTHRLMELYLEKKDFEPRLFL